MVSHLFYYQLALLVLVWLFVMLHVAGSRQGAQIPPTATPITPKRKRSNEPQPFDGHCQVVDHPPQPMTSYPQPYPLADRANLRRDSRHDATR